MTTYRVADGHNIALGSLTTISPQPRSTGVQATRRTYVGAGVYEEGLYVELQWDVLQTGVMYQDILTLFGVNTELTNQITLYARNEVFAWRRYNGLAIRPEVGRDVTWDRFRPRRILLLIRDLVLI